MAKNITSYVCNSCGHNQSKWLGQCPSCGEWNSLKEFHHPREESSDIPYAESNKIPVKLSDVKELPPKQYPTGISEMDRVLGGGLSPGTAVLLGGEPGIGKSTLMLQMAAAVRGKCLYVSGEESLEQLKNRAERLKINQEHIEVVCEFNLSALLETLKTGDYSLVIIDSIQTLIANEAGTLPGTVNQLKYVCHRLVAWSKNKMIPIILIAHITKEGSIAGPKIIEHLVDTVLYFEQTSAQLRILHASKNRMGSVDEVGLFYMSASGLSTVTDTAGLFLERRENPMPAGNTVTAIYEGSRILLVEVQALTVPSKAGLGRVYSDKIDSAKVSRIAAVLERHAKIRFSDQDIYVNIAGGLRIQDTGSELALAMALFSARTERSLSSDLVATGELSLAGEIRTVPHLRRRIKASTDTGFQRWLCARSSDENGPFPGNGIECRHISDAIASLMKL